jgi:hypothetical protein
VPPELRKNEESFWALLPPEAAILMGVAVVGRIAQSVKSAELVVIFEV